MTELLFLRDAYLQRRLSLIHDGNPPRDRQTEEDLDDIITGVRKVAWHMR